jgi:hypothetical protein
MLFVKASISLEISSRVFVQVNVGSVKDGSAVVGASVETERKY